MILVTGATGYIGSRLIRRLCASGYSVRAMVIDNDPLLTRLEGISCEIVRGDIATPRTLRPCLDGVKTVFHLAAVLVSGDKQLFHTVNYQGTENLVNAAVEAGVEHFVYISAAAAAYKKRTAYGDSKLRSETLMHRTGNTRYTIIRPTLVYGAGGGQEFNLYVQYLRRFPFIIPVMGMGKARKRFVWVEDIVDGLTRLVGKPVSYGKTYNFSGGTDLNMWECTRLIGRTFGIKKPLIGIPLWLCNLAAAVAALCIRYPLLNRDSILGVTMDANFDFEEAAKDIGYHPIGIEEGFKKAYAPKE